MDLTTQMPVRCLVVDDEPDFAEFVSDALDVLEFDSEVCTDPLKIGSSYSTSQSIIILDLFMPGMDGIEVLRFLHENKANASLIFMSGKDKSVLHSARELALEWGFPVLGAIEKPFSVDELAVVLDRFCETREVAATRDLTIELSDIAEALSKQQFKLAFQPQIRLSDQVVSGVEALIRWRHPLKGFISPGVFIPFAEENGLIEGINQFVARNAVAELGKWHREGLAFSLSINVSPASIADIDFPENLAALAGEHGVDPSQITVEVTETAVMSDVGSYIDILTRLRMKGFGLAIDDFGTGYSSLHQLVRLPFTELKVDQAFVSHAVESKERRTVVRMATMLAHQLEMSVVAEGVENEETLALLKNTGCDVVQGFYCARPMEAENLKGWLNSGAFKPMLFNDL